MKLEKTDIREPITSTSFADRPIVIFLQLRTLGSLGTAARGTAARGTERGTEGGGGLHNVRGRCFRFFHPAAD